MRFRLRRIDQDELHVQAERDVSGDLGPALGDALPGLLPGRQGVPQVDLQGTGTEKELGHDFHLLVLRGGIH